MLNSKSIVENKPIGSRIGSFETFDPNPWDKQFSYQLVDGNGSDDNDLFEVDENGTLINRVVFDFEKQARAKKYGSVPRMRQVATLKRLSLSSSSIMQTKMRIMTA